MSKLTKELAENILEINRLHKLSKIDICVLIKEIASDKNCIILFSLTAIASWSDLVLWAKDPGFFRFASKEFTCPYCNQSYHNKRELWECLEYHEFIIGDDFEFTPLLNSLCEDETR